MTLPADLSFFNAKKRAERGATIDKQRLITFSDNYQLQFGVRRFKRFVMALKSGLAKKYRTLNSVTWNGYCREVYGIAWYGNATEAVLELPKQTIKTVDDELNTVVSVLQQLLFEKRAAGARSGEEARLRPGNLRSLRKNAGVVDVKTWECRLLKYNATYNRDNLTSTERFKEALNHKDDNYRFENSLIEGCAIARFEQREGLHMAVSKKEPTPWDFGFIPDEGFFKIETEDYATMAKCLKSKNLNKIAEVGSFTHFTLGDTDTSIDPIVDILELCETPWDCLNSMVKQVDFEPISKCENRLAKSLRTAPASAYMEAIGVETPDSLDPVADLKKRAKNFKLYDEDNVKKMYGSVRGRTAWGNRTKSRKPIWDIHTVLDGTKSPEEVYAIFRPAFMEYLGWDEADVVEELIVARLASIGLKTVADGKLKWRQANDRETK